MQHLTKTTLGLVALAVGLSFTHSAMAMSSPDTYTFGYAAAPTSHVQVIEGEHIVNRGTPPLPQMPAPSGTRISADLAPPLPIGLNAMQIFPSPQSDIAGLIARYNRALLPAEITQMSQAIHLFSNAYGLDPHLLASLVAVESSFRPMAISRTGAVGLGQLKPDTAKWLGVENPYDPVQNISGVAKYLHFFNQPV